MPEDIFLIFPVHLFKDIRPLKNARCLLIEDPIYFTKFAFHKTKLVFHRASMKAYYDYLRNNGINVKYIEYTQTLQEVLRETLQASPQDASHGQYTISYYDPDDHDLTNKLNSLFKKYNVKNVKVYENPSFMLGSSDMKAYIADVKAIQKTKDLPRHYLHDASFYRWSRRRLNILVKDGKPEFGKWTFDRENRKPFPKGIKEPIGDKVYDNKYYAEAVKYIERNFPSNFGEIAAIYPVTFDDTAKVFKTFLKHKLELFGPYEDAISKDIVTGYHSGISAMLNVGLIMPQDMIKQVIKIYNDAEKSKKRELVPSVEGFIRQLIGWREYMRFLYKYYGQEMKTMNYFNLSNSLTGEWFSIKNNKYKETMPIIYDTLVKVHKRAYLHHIERLMVMGNFALYNEINPQQVYEWYMIAFVDSYDWVMVPNVFGMSQYALENFSMTQRPYLCGSSYLSKMSDYKSGKWREYWDALFYNFVNKHRAKLGKYRTYLFVKMYDAKNKEQKTKLAQDYKYITESY